MKERVKQWTNQNLEAWSDMLHILRRELYDIFTDKGALIVFFLACLVYPMVCGYIYNREILYEMPVAVVDDSYSALSREFVRRLDATPEVSIKTYCSSMEEARNLQKHSQVHGIVHLPEDFSLNINSSRQTTVGIYTDVSSFFWYRNLVLAASSVSLEMGGEIQAKHLLAEGETFEQAKAAIQPFKPSQFVLYNPGGYPSFILPIILILILQQTLLIGIGLLSGKTSQRSIRPILIPQKEHYRGLVRIVLGRGLALFVTYVPIMVYVLIIIPRFFNIPQLVDNPWRVIWFVLPFLFAVIFLGMTIGAFFKDRENAIPFYIFMSVPMLLLTGLSWLRESMPWIWERLSHLIPSTDAANGFARMTSMGSTLGELSAEWLWLCALSLLYFLTACLAYRYRFYKTPTPNPQTQI